MENLNNDYYKQIISYQYPNIDILFITLLGSRAYGYENKNSDYDVKFIFKYKDENKYNKDLKSNKIKNLVFSKYNMDFEGWDISKFLYKHYQHDIFVYEICASNEYLLNKLPLFSKKHLRKSYHRYVRKHYEKYIVKNKSEDINRDIMKKIIHCVRGLLCFIVLNNNEYPYVNMMKLFSQANPHLPYGLINIFGKLMLSCQFDKNLLKDYELDIIYHWIKINLYHPVELNDLYSEHHEYNKYNSIFNEIIYNR